MSRAHANKVELVPLCTRWLKNNAVLLSLEASLRNASLENVALASSGFVSAAICVYVTSELLLQIKKG